MAGGDEVQACFSRQEVDFQVEAIADIVPPVQKEGEDEGGVLHSISWITITIPIREPALKVPLEDDNHCVRALELRLLGWAVDASL